MSKVETAVVGTTLAAIGVVLVVGFVQYDNNLKEKASNLDKATVSAGKLAMDGREDARVLSSEVTNSHVKKDYVVEVKINDSGTLVTCVVENNDLACDDA